MHQRYRCIGVCVHVGTGHTRHTRLQSDVISQNERECASWVLGTVGGWGCRSDKANKKPDVERVCTRTAGIRSVLFTDSQTPSIWPRAGPSKILSEKNKMQHRLRLLRSHGGGKKRKPVKVEGICHGKNLPKRMALIAALTLFSVLYLAPSLL